MLIVKNISKIYKVYSSPKDRLKEILFFFRRTFHRKIYALNKVSFSVQKGETFGIIGANGSGKSTLLKLISGIFLPDEGSIIFSGKTSSLLELGIGFNPEMTGRENIHLYYLYHFNEPNISAELVDSIISFSGIKEQIDTPVKFYSSGMFVRLAFSCAIMVEPDFLIVDEALAVGDIQFQIQCFERIRELRKKGMGLLFVSHDESILQSLCDRCIVLSSGELVFEGDTKNALDFYRRMLYEKKLIPERNFVSRYGDQKAKILSVTAVNSLGAIQKDFFWGDPIRFQIKILFQANIENPTFGISIRNKLGLEIFGTNTKLLQQPSGNFASDQEVLVQFQTESRFMAGEYSLTVSVHDGNTHLETCYDWIDHAFDFKIIPKGSQNFSGIVDLNASFEILREDEKK